MLVFLGGDSLLLALALGRLGDLSVALLHRDHRPNIRRPKRINLRVMKVDIKLHGIGNSNSHCARPVY